MVFRAKTQANFSFQLNWAPGVPGRPPGGLAAGGGNRGAAAERGGLHGIEDHAGDPEDVRAQRGHDAGRVLRQEDLARAEQGRHISGGGLGLKCITVLILGGQMKSHITHIKQRYSFQRGPATESIL